MSELRFDIEKINQFYSKCIGKNIDEVCNNWNFIMDVAIPYIGKKYDVPCCYNISDIMKKISDFMWNKYKMNMKTFDDVYYGVYLYLNELEKENE